MNNTLIIKDLTKNDVDSILQLQEEIFATLDNPELLRRNTKEMFELCTKAPNWTFGAYDPEVPDRLVGIAIMFDPGDTEESIAAHLKLHNAANAVNAKLIMILKEYRGNGFQGKALRMMEERARLRGYDAICATVSPQNTYSKMNLISSGYEYDHTEKKYGGLERDVFFLKL